MMSGRKDITIKDVALSCGVSRALAAAVLSDSRNNIGCSDAKREMILRRAKEMNYHPNLFARAMRTGVSPLVAVCIRNVSTRVDEINTYLHDLLPNISKALLSLGYNTIFIPYEDIEDFIPLTTQLTQNNLISGIITNFPPWHVDEMVKYLKELHLPYVLMGKVPDESVVSIHIENRALSKALVDYGVERGYKSVVNVLAEQKGENEISLRVDSVMNDALKLGPDDLCRSDVLSASMGEFTRRMLIEKLRIDEKNIISIESKRILIQSSPAVFVKIKEKERSVQAAKILSEWIVTGGPPKVRRNVIELNIEDIEFIL